jgi:hypothetical protein
MLAVDMIRANAFCPSPTWIEDGSPRFANHYYLSHPSKLCHMAVFRPSGSFQDAPCAIFVHGKYLGANCGWAAMTTDLFVGKAGALAEALSQKGWVIISISYPITSINEHQRKPNGALGATKILGSWKEVHPVAEWPEQPAYVAAAVQYVKSNWTGIAGTDATIFGATLFGAGNSIDRDRVILVGDEWGAELAMYAALQPTGRYPFIRELAYDSMDAYDAGDSHRVLGVVALNPGPIDHTQLYVGRDPIQTKYFIPGTQTAGQGNTWSEPPGTPYYLKGDRFHPYVRAEGFRRWSRVPMKFKRASPWWVLKQGTVENGNLSFFVQFDNGGYDSGVGGWDQNLSSADFSPGTVRSNSAGGKAFIRPDDGRFLGPPLRDLLWGYGGPAPSSAGLPIRKSVVRDPVVGGAYPPYSQADLPGAVLAWAGTLGVPSPFI